MEKTIQVDSWEELISKIEDVNPYKHTIVLSGFINEQIGDKYVIKRLIFTIKPVEILKN